MEMARGAGRTVSGVRATDLGSVAVQILKRNPGSVVAFACSKNRLPSLQFNVVLPARGHAVGDRLFLARVTTPTGRALTRLAVVPVAGWTSATAAAIRVASERCAFETVGAIAVPVAWFHCRHAEAFTVTTVRLNDVLASAGIVGTVALVSRIGGTSAGRTLTCPLTRT